MKLICKESLRDMLELEFMPYRKLDITLVQKGCTWDGVGIIFDMEHFQEVHDVVSMMMQKQEKTIIGRQKDRMYPILISDILYIEGYRKEAYLHTMTNTYRISYRLYEAEALLEQDGFLRVNKSTIVNIRKIKCIIPSLNACYTLEMMDGVCLECSRQYWKQFKKRLTGR